MHDLITKNVGRKLFALLMAVLIWLTVNYIIHVEDKSRPAQPLTTTNLNLKTQP